MKTTILCLGGNHRERLPEALIQFQLNPSAQLILTGVGDSHPTTPWIQEQIRLAGVPPNQLIIDGLGAWDTVTEFTLTLGWIQAYGSRLVLPVTSHWHCARAAAIAGAAYFMRGIRYAMRPSSPPDPVREKKDAEFISYDRNRTVLWRATGILQYDRKIRRARQPWWDGK